MASNDFVELNRIVKDTQILQRRFQKLKSQVTGRLGNGKGDDEQILLDMKKFYHFVKTLQGAYFLTHSGNMLTSNFLSSVESNKDPKRFISTSLSFKPKTIDPDDIDLDYAHVDRLSPPPSPTRKSRREELNSIIASRKRQRSQKEKDLLPVSKKSKTQQKSGIQSGTTVAARIPSTSKKEAPTWILASVVQYIPESDKYQVQDEDAEGDAQYGHFYL